jgi:hypothetical protein
MKGTLEEVNKWLKLLSDREFNECDSCFTKSDELFLMKESEQFVCRDCAANSTDENLASVKF